MRLVSNVAAPQAQPRHQESRLIVVSDNGLPTQRYNTAIRAVPERKRTKAVESVNELSRASQNAAYARKAIVEWVLANESACGSRSQAIELLLSRAKVGRLQAILMANLESACKGKKLPGKSIVHEWVKTWQNTGGNLVSIAPKETGKCRTPQPWDLACLQMYHIPSKPSFTSVAFQLQLQGYQVTAPQVRNFILSLPAEYGPDSPWRLGKHYYQQNRGRYVIRDKSVLDVGEVYQGDGHTVDAYIGHPNHGGPWRPELTVWIDVRSTYISGWYLSEAESSTSTLFALSHALISNDHVPAWVHIDNGSGYKSKLMSDDSTGFYARFNISTTFAIPGNSKGKGLVEKWFHFFRDNHDKFFNGGQDYCGHDMAEETNRRITDSITRGKRTLATFAQYRDSVAAFIHAYNNRPSPSLEGKTPAQLWANLERVPVELPDIAVIRPMSERMARRQTVQIHNRAYEHPALFQYEGRYVCVEYDLHNDARVWIYDDKHRLICEAELKNKVAYLPESRLEEARKNREDGRIKRLQKKMDLVRAEESRVIDHTKQLDALEHMGADEWEDIHEPQPGISITFTDDDF